LVLAATAIPIGLRPVRGLNFGMGSGIDDIALNILGFTAVGAVLAREGFWRAVAAGGLLSSFAEMIQIFSAHRDPSVIDVICNVLGTMLGATVVMRWRLPSPELKVGKWTGAVAAIVALALFWETRLLSGDGFNARGASLAGALEAAWNFDEPSGATALDSSGHNLHGTFRNKPERIAGVRGGAVRLDGVKDYIDAGRNTAFRLEGSMTISAWINSKSFPKDDAAILSQLKYGRGYQIDTTVDQKIRGIGFKLTNSCGDFVARYGSTPLSTGQWYHVAGVYDAKARTLDVYLSGRLDNGPLVGTVTGAQYSSRSPTYIGRRSDLEGFEFAGSIDEVHIYSFALSKEEIAADMRGDIIPPAARANNTTRPPQGEPPCGVSIEYEDSKIPLIAAALGVLAAVAGVGLWPPKASILCFLLSFAAGLALVPFMASNVPTLSRWMMPLVSLAGGASIAGSLVPPRTRL
jgi:hypothetical protein